MSATSSERLVYDDDSRHNSQLPLDPREALRAHLRSFKLYKPKFVLALFVAMNFWTYYDRGAMSTSVATIRADPTISGGSNPVSETEAGLLVSIFMVGYLASSPLFTALGGLLSAKTIILIGLGVWCLACLLTGLVHGFYLLLTVRAFVGVGEAAYCGYTVTIVDNMAPPELRTLWIGIFYAMIPVGTALGMAVGGVLSSDGGSSSFAGWRLAFVTEIIPMVIVVVFTFFMPAAYNPVRDNSGKKKGSGKKGDSEALMNDNTSTNATEEVATTAAGRSGDEFVPILTAVGKLACNLDYVLLVFGYGMYTFVLGGISVWAVSFMSTGPLHTTKVSASLFLGGTVALGGMLGSLAGGVAVDKMGGSFGYQGMYKCAAFNTGMILISLPLGVLALTSKSFAVYAIPFLVSVLALFAVTAPVNSAILSSVPRNIRTYAVTFGITIMHLTGDVPSPVFAGFVADKFDNGCSQWNHNQTLCQGAVGSAADCVWVPKGKHTDEYCTNEYELRNALLVVFGFLALAIPAWGVVALRNRRRTGDADHPDGDGDDVLGPLIRGGQPAKYLLDVDQHE